MKFGPAPGIPNSLFSGCIGTFCGCHLSWQRKEVDQHVASQFMCLICFHLVHSVNFVKCVVANDTEAMRPRLKVRGNFVIFRQFFDALVEGQLRKIRRDGFRREFQCTPVHRDGRIPMLTLQCFICLYKRFLYCFRAVAGCISFLWFGMQTENCPAMEVSVNAQRSVHGTGIASSGIQGSNHRLQTCIAGVKGIPNFTGFLPLGSQREGRILGMAVRAIQHQGEGHAYS